MNTILEHVDFIDVNEEISDNSIVWDFFKLVERVSENEDERKTNYQIVGEELKDKLGQKFSLKELEDWLASRDNTIEDVLNAIELEISQYDDIDEANDIDGCGGSGKAKKVSEEDDDEDESDDEEDDD